MMRLALPLGICGMRFVVIIKRHDFVARVLAAEHIERIAIAAPVELFQKFVTIRETIILLRITGQPEPGGQGTEFLAPFLGGQIVENDPGDEESNYQDDDQYFHFAGGRMRAARWA